MILANSIDMVMHRISSYCDNAKFKGCDKIYIFTSVNFGGSPNNNLFYANYMKSDGGYEEVIEVQGPICCSNTLMETACNKKYSLPVELVTGNTVERHII